MIGRNAVAERVRKAARTLNFVAPDVADKLVDIDSFEVTVDPDSLEVEYGDGVDKAIEAALKKVADDNEGLVKAPKGGQLTNAGGGGQAEKSGSAGFSSSIRKKAGREE